jgi:hypothetical protein
LSHSAIATISAATGTTLRGTLVGTLGYIAGRIERAIP